MKGRGMTLVKLFFVDEKELKNTDKFHINKNRDVSNYGKKNMSSK